MRILAVETSCDETAAAVVERAPDSPWAVTIKGVVASQAKLHEKYGGVYPEVASREHSKQILPVLAEALSLNLYDRDRLPMLDLHAIDYLAVTIGPGLIGSLLVGVQTIATLGLASGIPILPINHLAGHIYASFLALPEDRNHPPRFPLMALIVSGGHTLLLSMSHHNQFQLLGQTRDDAAGEAFDKVAKLLDLGYPGGPRISELARKGDRTAYRFPIGLEHEATLDFSFSGLKTAVLREVQGKTLTQSQKADVAASFERAVVEALLLKISRALDTTSVNDFILGGGVAANTYLRERLATLLAHRRPAVNLHVPSPALCTDNAEVIGAAAAFSDLMPMAPRHIQAFARLPLALMNHTTMVS